MAIGIAVTALKKLLKEVLVAGLSVTLTLTLDGVSVMLSQAVLPAGVSVTLTLTGVSVISAVESSMRTWLLVLNDRAAYI
jgi:hypothetical protein